jgi:hypothetical protein
LAPGALGGSGWLWEFGPAQAHAGQLGYKLAGSGARRPAWVLRDTGKGWARLAGLARGSCSNSGSRARPGRGCA